MGPWRWWTNLRLNHHIIKVTALRYNEGKSWATSVFHISAWLMPFIGYTHACYSLLLSKKKEWIIHSIYGVKRFHSLRSEFHSILTLVEWKFTTQQAESRPVHSIFTPKEVITEVTQWQKEWKFTPFLKREKRETWTTIIKCRSPSKHMNY